MKRKVISVTAYVLLAVSIYCSLGYCDSSITQIQGASYGKISANGHYLVFQSGASDLVPNDTNSVQDIFVTDLITGLTSRMSITNTGAQANGMSQCTSISANGRFIAFESGATNLVTGDTNNHNDIFVHDQLTGANTRVSVANDGTQANDWCTNPTISPDGRYVKFDSWATNLIKGYPREVYGSGKYLYDLYTKQIKLVPWSSPSFSNIDGNGNQYVAFYSGDGTLSGDTNGVNDVFVTNLSTWNTERISVAFDGVSAANGESTVPSISADGRYVAFTSRANNLVEMDNNIEGYRNVFLRDRGDSSVQPIIPASTTKVSVNSNGEPAIGDGSSEAYISANGRYVAFTSWATNLMNGLTGVDGVFRYDAVMDASTIISIPNNGETNARCNGPTINADGSIMTYRSNINYLGTSNTNTYDLFVYDSGIHPTPSPDTPPFVAGASADKATYTVGIDVMTFTAKYQDINGCDDIAYCYADINTTFNELKSICLIYDQVNDKLYMKNDAGSEWLGGITSGTTGNIQNSQCTVYFDSNTVEKDLVTNILTIKWKIVFKSPMAGKICNSWLRVTDKGDPTNEWQDWKSMNTSITVKAPKKK